MEGWIGVGLDGTLAEYDEWRGAQYIGKPVGPMMKRVKRWLKADVPVKILTPRANIPDFIPHVEHWLMEHGLLPEDEAAKAYKKFLIRKGRDPKKASMKKSGGASKPSKPRPKPSVKKEAKSPAVKKVGGIKRKAALDDDDSDSDMSL